MSFHIRGVNRGGMRSNDQPDRGSLDSLQDRGITWFFYFQKEQVPRFELETIARAERERFLRLAVTFGSIDPKTLAYQSSTAVHLWQMDKLPPSVSWRRVLVHVFTHEPLHHAIGRCLAETMEWGDQEWAIARLGDGRWW
jgi:hypothetical protein